MQAAISFAVSLAVTIIGIGYLHDSRWVRAFLALGLLYVVTSSFTLAKCIRDRQEEGVLVSRVDQARLDKLLAEQDLLRVGDHYGRPGYPVSYLVVIDGKQPSRPRNRPGRLHPAAVGGERGAVEVCRVGRDEEGDRGGDLLGVGEAPERGVQSDLGAGRQVMPA